MLSEEEKRQRGLEANRKWREKNRERELERHRNRVYTEEERRYRRQKGREYHAENRERLVKYSRDYYEKHKDRLNVMTKERMLYKNARSRSRIKNVPFNIEESDIVIPKTCPVFPWIELCATNTSSEDNSPSVDRVIPELGYVKGNIQIISRRANTIKSMGSAEEHERIAEWLREITN